MTSIEASLSSIAELWQLSDQELAHAFSVPLMTYQQWGSSGLPISHSSDFHLLKKATDILETNLAPALIPQVVRRPAENLSGASLVDLLSSGRFAQLYAAVSAAFDLRKVQP